MWPALIAAGASIANGLINMHQQKKYNDQIIEEARQAATTSYNRQREFWREQADYASPGNQAKLLAAAGINPNLIAGGNIGAIPSTPSVAQSATPYGQAPQMVNDIGSSIEMGANVQRILTQNRNESTVTGYQVMQMAADLNLTIQEANHVAAKINEVNAATAKLKLEAEGITYENDSKKFKAINDGIDAIIRGTYIEDEMDSYQARLKREGIETNLKENELRYVMSTLAARIYGVNLSNRETASKCHINESEAARLDKFIAYADAIYKAQGDEAAAQAATAQYDADLKKDYGSLEKVVGLVGECVELVTELGSFGRSVKGFGKLFKRKKQ